jgi:chalcone isomerase
VRGLDIDGEFVKFTVLGVYLEEKAIASLTPKWNGKTPSQLFESLDFYRDIIKGTNIYYIMIVYT